MRPDLEAAILSMYDTIDRAAEIQAATGHSDQGRRAGITSGKHLDSVVTIIKKDLVNIGFNSPEIYDKGRSCTLPGWFRATKNWDLLAFDEGVLVAAIELKSISSSFGNNANNRAEESIGSAFDAQQAYHEHLFGETNIPPVMGYVMIVLDCEESRRIPAKSYLSHFHIDTVFKDTSYLDRFRILCERLRRKSLYNAVWLVFANPTMNKAYEPDSSMSYEVFIKNIEMGLSLQRCQRGKSD